MLTSILLAVALFTAPTTAPDTVKSLTSPEAIKVIDHFLQHPEMSDEAKQINKFAEDSEECVITVDEEVAPWAAHDPPYAQNEVLITAFVAGDVKSQLVSHKVEDDPYAGMLAVIQTYEKLREADPKLAIPEIDDMIAMEKRGELKSHAEEIVKKRGK